MNKNTRDQIRQWIAQKQVSVVESPAPVEVQTQPTQPTQPTELVIQPTELVEPRSVIRDEIILGNCMEVLKKIPSNIFSAIITDPPYGLEFMGKEFDSPWKQLSGWQNGGGFSKPGIGDRKTAWPSFSATSLYGGANPTCGTCGGRARGEKKCSCETPNWKPIGKRKNPENEGLPDDVTSTGMAKQMKMFQEWNEAWAKEVLRVLKPGGHLLSFGSTRTSHRMVCGIEDAGFQIRDKISYITEIGAIHGQGFPKSLSIGRSMRKAGLPQADQWNSHGTALKPAVEPCVVFGKSSEDTEALPLEMDVPFKYQAKASGKERNAGCENLFWLKGDDGKDVLISKEDYDGMVAENESRKDEEGFQRYNISQGNNHPTIKSLELIRYLVKMAKMPGDNLILDCFAGSGTTLVACVLEGCNFVGIDMDENYVKIAQARVDYAKKYGEDGYK